MENESEKARRVAGERGLTSSMNDTKWREVCEAFRQWSMPPPRYRIHDLLAGEGYVSDWDREWHHHPRPYMSIRWLEVELAPGDVPQAVATCKRIGAAVEVTATGVRLWGWVDASDISRLA